MIHSARTIRGRAGSRLTGLLLVAVGVWLILSGLGVRMPRVEHAWPVLLIGVGLALLAEAGFGARGALFVGVIVTLTGGFLLLFAVGAWGSSWADLNTLWPVFLLIIATAFLTLYLVDEMREAGLLLSVMAIGGTGIVALPFTLGVMRGRFVTQMLRFWPLLAALIILALLFGHADRD